MDVLSLPDRATPAQRVFWASVTLAVLGIFVWAGGIPTGLLFIVSTSVAVLLAFIFPFSAFLLSIAAAPLIGVTVSISTGTLYVGERAFGGAIDITPAEVVVLVVLCAWAARLLYSLFSRKSIAWRPWLPLAMSFAFLLLAHVASLLSPASPDPWLVLKYTLRPVALAYVAWVLVPVNFITNRRRLILTLCVVVGVATFFALDAWRSLLTFREGIMSMRLHPVPWLGISPIGENHNVLAELLVSVWPFGLLLASLSSRPRVRRALYGIVILLGVTALLTFARSAWIALAAQVLFLSCTVWRDLLPRVWHYRWLVAFAATPVIGYMLFFSISPGVGSSTDARATMLSVAFQAFRDSPLVGVGAGMFIDTLGRTKAYTLDFGTPFDSHGILQKLMAETGLFGLLAFCGIIAALGWRVRHAFRVVAREHQSAYPLYIATAAAGGALLYQLFNTTYWTAKLWLPIGLLLAVIRMNLEHKNTRDTDFLSPLA